MLPRIAITMGDPGGVGPEVILKALQRPEVREALRPLVVGDAGALRRAHEVVGGDTPVQVSSPEEEPPGKGVPVLAPPDLPVGAAYRLGLVDAANGRAAYCSIVHATRLALDGVVSGICTAPISKEAMFAAGYDFPGHTELLAHLCGDVPVRMMLAGGGLRVALQTIHVALAEVPALLNTEGILQSLQIMDAWGRKALGRAPRIGMCGLNPHAGEAGHFGREEIEIIAPAIERAAVKGIATSGPYPADTIYHRALEGDFDIVLAMYHDQALIPVKTLDFHGGVNITLGLPFTRTSPDHGTAFALAGSAQAREDSMVAALLAAAIK